MLKVANHVRLEIFRKRAFTAGERTVAAVERRVIILSGQ